MLHKKLQHVVLSLAMMCAAAEMSLAQTNAPAQAEDVEEVRLSAGRDDEYDSVIVDLGLEGEQKAAFEAKAADRLVKLRAFIDSAEGKKLVELRTKLAAVRRERKTAEIEPLRKEIEPLSKQYWDVRQSTRRDLLRTLNEDQIKRYVGYILMQRVGRPLGAAALDAEQLKAARAIANRYAGEWVTAEIVENDPFFAGLLPLEAPARKEVIDTVLTDDQRAKLRPATRATQPS